MIILALFFAQNKVSGNRKKRLSLFLTFINKFKMYKVFYGYKLHSVHISHQVVTDIGLSCCRHKPTLNDLSNIDQFLTLTWKNNTLSIIPSFHLLIHLTKNLRIKLTNATNILFV